MKNLDWEETTHVPEGEGDPRIEDKLHPYLVIVHGVQMGRILPLNQELLIGRSPTATLHLTGGGISRFHCRIRPTAEQFLLEDLGSRNGTYIGGQKIQTHILNDGDKIYLGTSVILKFVLCDPVEEAFAKQMSDWIFRDSLTGAFSRRYLLEQIEREVLLAEKEHHPLSLIVLDLDHFKQVNDCYGHLAGDYVLVRFAEQVSHCLSQNHCFIRYGGEEFMIIAPRTSRLQALELADQVRAAIENMPLLFQDQSIAITVSVGLATIPDDPIKIPLDLIALADQALYLAKARGRNCIAFPGDQWMDTTCPD